MDAIQKTGAINRGTGLFQPTQAIPVQESQPNPYASGDSSVLSAQTAWEFPQATWAQIVASAAQDQKLPIENNNSSPVFVANEADLKNGLRERNYQPSGPCTTLASGAVAGALNDAVSAAPADEPQLQTAA